MLISKGYIIDAPKATLYSGDDVAVISTAKSGELSAKSDSLKINGGWDTLALAEIATTTDMEVKLVDAQWKFSMLQTSTGGTGTIGKRDIDMDNTLEVKTNSITIPRVVKEKTVVVSGLKEVTTTTPLKGTFKVTISPTETIVLFAVDEFVDGTFVTVGYKVDVDKVESLDVTSLDVPAGGRLILEYPVYGNINKNTQDVIGYLQWEFYKVAVTPEISMGGSYKTASEFGVTFKVLASERDDKKNYSVKLFKLA